MSLLTLRESIRATIDDQVAELIEVRTTGGRFNMDELKRWALRSPSAAIAVLGVNDTEMAGSQVTSQLLLGAFLICADAPQKSRDAHALLLLPQMLQVISPAQRWGDDNCAGVPTQIRADNLYSPQLDQMGVALWAITWRQQYDLPTEDVAALDDFLTYHSRWDLAPTDTLIDAEDEVTLPAPEEDDEP